MNKTVTFRNGVTVPALGQGTWFLGEDPRTHDEELAALRAGIDSGMTLIDTAEMYGSGLSEELVGEAISAYNREDLFVVSKFYPHHADRYSLREALEGTLERLGTDYLDLYLYHWRGSVPLAETVSTLEDLKAEGRIKEWGVSNFDTDDMEDLWAVPDGNKCLVNQVLYHVGSRGIDYDLLPWMRDHDVALMAYCPLGQMTRLNRSLNASHALESVCARHDASLAQVMLAWAVRDGHTIAIPRSSKKAHTLDNVKADNLVLGPEDLDRIDEDFPAPTRKMYLDVV